MFSDYLSFALRWTLRVNSYLITFGKTFPLLVHVRTSHANFVQSPYLHTYMVVQVYCYCYEITSKSLYLNIGLMFSFTFYFD